MKKRLKSGKSLSQQVVRGGFWVFILRITERLFGLIRLIILARILAPHDFGLIATAALATKFARQILNLGFPAVIVQREKISKDLIYTVFTTNIVLHAIMLLLLESSTTMPQLLLLMLFPTI